MKRIRKLKFEKYKQYDNRVYFLYKVVSDSVILNILDSVIKNYQNEAEIKKIKLKHDGKCYIKIKAEKNIFYNICLAFCQRNEGNITNIKF